MEVLLLLFASAIFLFLFAVVGHVMWLMGAAVYRAIWPQVEKKVGRAEPTAESDLWETAEALRRMLGGRLISAEAYRAMRTTLEEAARLRSIPLPPAERILAPAEQILAPAEQTQPEPALLSSNESAPPILAELANDVAQAEEQHALERDYSVEPPAIGERVAMATRRTMGDMLQQFLNEKNIQWGELISGLLIIGSAVGLILSLRTELNRVVPMFPALLFFAVTVAIHLAGFYTFKRWKLPSTSRGILLIGSLMVPISALAACLLADHGGSASLWEWSLWIPIVVGGVTFSYLSVLAGRHLYTAQPFLWMLAVVPSGLAMGFINRTGDEYVYFWTFAAIASSSIASLLGVVVGLHWHAKRSSTLEEDSATMRPKWKLVGVAALSAITALGLTLFRARDRSVDSTLYAIPSSVWGCVLMMLGSHLLIESRRWRTQSSSQKLGGSPSAKTIASELGGASIVLLGALASILALGLSALSPNLLLLISAVNLVLSIAALLISRHVMLTVAAAFNGSIVFWLVSLWSVGGLPAVSIGEGMWDWSWILVAIQQPESGWIFLFMGLLSAGFAKAVNWRTHGALAKSFSDSSALSENCPREGLHGFEWATHSAALMTIGAIHALIAFFLAARLGWVGQTLLEVATGAAILGFFAMGLSFVGIRVGNVLACMAGSLSFLIWMAVLVRENSELGRIWGLQTQSLEDRVVVGLLGHALLVAATSVVLYAMEKRYDREQADLGRKNCLDRFYVTGLVTASLSLISLLQWHRVERCLWEGVGFLVIAFLYGIGQYRLRTATVESVKRQMREAVPSREADQPFEQITVAAIGMAMAKWLSYGINQTMSLGLTYGAIYSWLLSLVGVLFAGYWMLRVARQSSSRRRLFFFGDGMTVAVLVYHSCHFVGSVMVWNTLTGQGLQTESVLWMSSTILSLATWIWLSLQRSTGYEWLAGIQSAICMFLGLYFFAPPSSTPVNLFYLMAASPMALVLLFSIVHSKASSVRSVSTSGVIDPERWLYRSVISWMAIIAWLAISVVTLIGHLERPQSSERGLLELGGIAWLGVGIAAIVYRWLLSPNALRSFQVFAATAVVWLQFPIAMNAVWSLALPSTTMLLACCIAVSLHSLVWTLFAWRGGKLRRWLQVRLGIEDRAVEQSHLRAVCPWIWFVMFWCLLLSNGLGWDALNSGPLRLTALTTFLIGGVLLVSDRLVDWPMERKRSLRLAALSCGTLFAIWFAWSGIDGQSVAWSKILVHRLLRFTVVCILMTMVVSWTHARFAMRLSDVWRITLRDKWSIVACLSGISVGLTIVVLHGNGRDLGLRSDYSAEVLGVLIALLCWMIQWVVQALFTDFNVAGLEKRWKELYIYAAEACFVLILGLAYTQFSEWFELPLREYWPIGLLLVAIVSQGVSRVIRRAGIEAVSNPLENTSLLLPLLASSGMVFITSEVKADVVLILTAFFYFALGAAEGSRRFAVLGVTFSNIALALFWERVPSLDFFEHPQLWVIPPAISVLVASHLYRSQWKSEMTTWIRYMAVLAIFMSSTFEVLIVGFGKQLWPPMILMVLSILTVFLGMALRVRSYLFSGALFLLVSITSMVAHAQQSLQHTWPWWVLGISLGTGVLVLYGVFEKKREQFRELSEQLRRWQP